jgi:plasmid stabilization system protein ParE
MSFTTCFNGITQHRHAVAPSSGSALDPNQSVAILVSMKLVVHPAAQKEFDRKVDYLHRKGILANAAELFVDEIEQALVQIQLEPGKQKMPRAPGYFRVGPTKRFSYNVIYQVTGDTIEVIAISAPQRRPGYWKRRRL